MLFYKCLQILTLHFIVPWRLETSSMLTKQYSIVIQDWYRGQILSYGIFKVIYVDCINILQLYYWCYMQDSSPK